MEATLDGNKFEDDEESGLFMNNVLSVLDGNELRLSRDQGTLSPRLRTGLRLRWFCEGVCEHAFHRLTCGPCERPQF